MTPTEAFIRNPKPTVFHNKKLQVCLYLPPHLILIFIHKDVYGFLCILTKQPTNIQEFFSQFLKLYILLHFDSTLPAYRTYMSQRKRISFLIPLLVPEGIFNIHNKHNPLNILWCLHSFCVCNVEWERERDYDYWPFGVKVHLNIVIKSHK